MNPESITPQLGATYMQLGELSIIRKDLVDQLTQLDNRIAMLEKQARLQKYQIELEQQLNEMNQTGEGGDDPCLV
jgi:PleD family two-component response regulator